MGIYRLIHAFNNADGSYEQEEKFFRFQKRAKEAAAKKMALVGFTGKMKWEISKTDFKQIYKVSDDEGFMIEPIFLS